jgi:uncharacterized protein
MYNGKGFWSAVALVCIVGLPGCATHSSRFAAVEREVAKNNPAGAIVALDGLKLSGQDQLLHHLNKATLLRFQQQYEESNREFETAKGMMASLDAISASEQVGSVVVNDTVKAYEGADFERLLLFSLKSLNYLQGGDTASAAVEARQFDIGLRLMKEKNPNATYLDGAFVRYLNGMIYEAAGEKDAARIEYENSLEAYRKQGTVAAPQALEADATRLKASAANGAAKTGEAVFVLHNGLGPSLAENVMSIPNPSPATGTTMFSIALPQHAARMVPVARVELSSGEQNAKSEVVEDVNEMARKSLEARLPAITSRAVARMVVKSVATKAAKDNSDQLASSLGPWGSILGAAMDVGSTLTERADTRSWSLLPGNIHMARLNLPAGKHDVKVSYYDANNALLGSVDYPGVEVRSGQKTFMASYFISTTAPASVTQTASANTNFNATAAVNAPAGSSTGPAELPRRASANVPVQRAVNSNPTF